MTKNKRIYKYTSIISLIIAIALIASLIIPSFTIASGESISISENDNDELVVTTKINNANVGKSTLFIIKAESLAMPSNPEEMETFANQHIGDIKGEISSTSQTFTIQKEGPGKYYAVILLKEEKNVQDPENEGNTIKREEYTETVSNSYTVSEGDNSGENQGGNQGENQGGNQGENQGGNQGENQGGNQGENQGGNQGENQGENQGGNQGENQGENQGDKPSETPAITPSTNPADQDDDVLQVKVEDDKKVENNNPEDYKDLNENKPANQNDNKPDNNLTNQNENKTNQSVESNNNNNKQNANNNNSNTNNTVTEKKSEENIPQTGSNETAIIVAIVAFSIISLGSFVKYRRVR